MAAFVSFWGTRGSIPTPGRKTARYGGNTSSVEVRMNEAVFVCDGGTGLRELGLDLQRRAAGVPLEAHLFFSHMHWDHIQGFPFFTPAYLPSTTLHVYDPSPTDRRVQRLLQGQMQHEYFPVSFSALGATFLSKQLGDGGTTVVAGVQVTAHEQEHPGKSFAYAFEHEGKKVVYATDSELDLLASERDLIQRHPERPRTLPETLVRFVAGADLLIADGQYTDEEYPQKVGWGHARATTVVDLALQAGVRQLAIFHHDPLHTDEDVERLLARCRERVEARGKDLLVFGAREGMELKL